MKRLGPFTVVAGTTLSQLIGQQADTITAVKIKNESNLLLAIDGPDRNSQEWLAPWQDDLFYNRQAPGNQIVIVPSLPSGGLPSLNPPSSSVLFIVYETNDIIPPGAFPVANDRVGNPLNSNPNATYWTANVTGSPWSAGLSCNSPSLGGKLIYITGCDATFERNASGNLTALVVIAGLAGATAPSWYVNMTASAQDISLLKTFPYALPANAPNQIVSLQVSVAIGAGSAAGATLNLYGYYL
jgi:hypothetical protein